MLANVYYSFKKMYGPMQNGQGEKTKGGGQEMAVRVIQWQKF